MLEIIFLLILGFIWIVTATIQDIRKKEVDNWINFSLIIFALGFRFFYSLFSNNGFGFFYQGLIGLGIFFLLGNIFYYSRVFAGGDAKLMIALGTILPVSSSFYTNIRYFILFLLIFLFVGTVYGLIWSLTLVFRNAKAFTRRFKTLFRKNKNIVFILMFLGLFFMILGFYQIFLFILGLLLFIAPYFFVYAKAIDDVAMVRKINTKGLREGDWLFSRIKIGRRYIEPNWEGLSKKEVSDIKKRYRFVKIRQGVVFVPVFLISFILFVYGILLGTRIVSFILPSFF
jgi:Flp pilus assembly protein protease CpaA